MKRFSALAFVLALSCSASEHKEPRPPAVAASVLPPSPALRASSSAPSEAPRSGESAGPYEVAILEPKVLSALEARGFGLGPLVFGVPARSTRELDRTSAMKSIFQVLRADVSEAKRFHPLARVTSMDGFRLFDERWLSSDEMTFALTGVFNRLDRRAFYAGTCGELRFVYRLLYETKQGGAPMASRLPMTVNAVYIVPSADGSCRDVARAWQSPPSADPTVVADWLGGRGPLSAKAREGLRLKSVETNLQSFRLQSSVHPSLGGHIDYDMRVFHATDEKRTAFAPAAMENMPELAALGVGTKLRAELLAVLRDAPTLAALDRGTLNLPERFLAKRAVSVAPRGLSRLANRPFRKLFQNSDFDGLDLGGFRTIRSPAALVRRLDGATCVGCHQSRPIAGFHHVGRDPSENPTYDSLFSGSSAHLEADFARRHGYVEKIAAGEEPDEFRPIPERQGAGNGFGAPCGLGDPGFADWTCAAGLRCEKLEDGEIGVCLTATAVGSPCEYGEMRPGTPPHRDQVANMQHPACSEKQRCDGNFSGFPLGACTASCSGAGPSGSCADFLDVDGFQNCLRGKLPVEKCATDFVFGAGVRACDADDPCRQDYVCVRTKKPGVGACVPPYFVYQLRLDGYPLMR